MVEIVKKCKTVVIVYDYGFMNGGAAKVAIKSALGLCKKGIRVIYFSAVGPVCQELIESNVKTICLDMDDINTAKKKTAIWNGIWNLKAEKELKELLTDLDRNNTVVHFHGWSKALSSSVIYAASSKKFKIFITCHEYFSLCPNGGFYDYQKEEICSCEPMSLSCVFLNCDKRSYTQKVWRVCRQFIQDFVVRRNQNIHYISISDLNENVIKRYITHNCFSRIKNPIQFGDQVVKNITESRVILYVGRLSEEKGIALFCEAVEILRKAGTLVEGIVVGEGEKGRKLAEKYSDVKFVGWKNEMEVKEFMSNARALVFPSKWYEGAPLTIVEAMSMGLPCIVSDCTSGVELIRDNWNGLLFRSNDILSLTEKISFILEDDNAVRLSQNLCHYFNRDEYAEEVYISSLLNVYTM